MKKLIICLLVLFLFSSNLLNKHIVLPQAIISELLFTDNSNWSLEIGFAFNELCQYQDFDSICISTSNGISKMKLDNLKENDSLFVINAESLISPLSINRDGDCVKLCSYLSSNSRDANFLLANSKFKKTAI